VPGPEASVRVVAWGAAALFAAAIACRGVLIAYAPDFRGYRFDDVWEPVEIALRTDEFPHQRQCRQCYQAPLLYVVWIGCMRLGDGLGVPRELARWAPLALNAAMSLGLVGVTAAVLLRLGVGRRDQRWLALALSAVVPTVFINTAAQNLDVGVNFFMALSLWGALAIWARPAGDWRRAAGAGLAAALAMASKYSGLIAGITLGQLWLASLTARDGRARIRALGLALALALAFGSIVYVRNWIQTGTPLPGNRHNESVFALRGKQLTPLSEFLRFDPLALARYPFERPLDPALNKQPVYRAPLMGFYGTFWSDLGAFSRPGVATYSEYSLKIISPWLQSAILVLGMPVMLVAALGVIETRRRAFWPLHFATFNHLALAFFYRWLGNPWYLKFTYNLMLVVPFAFYLAAGLALLASRWPRLERAALALVAVQALLCLGFDWRFSIE
jgi:4-amino-4-deoxy-L-arabinose transferase-like glycosyltransferase